MKKLIALTIMLAVLIAVPAAPALAYKRKRTVTVGVDPNGVPIKIEVTVSGAGRSRSGAGGGGGTPCQYALASGSGSGLYANQPADVGLFTITCGTHVDVRYLRISPGGQPLVPGRTVDPYQLDLLVRDRLVLPT